MRITNFTGLIISLFIFISLFSACKLIKKEPMKIAVSKTSANYTNWLKKADSGLLIIDMYHMDIDSALAVLDHCSGLLVTGGEDVQPGYYGKADEKSLCGTMDPKRDTLEIFLIKKAISRKMPVLGICRGEQILNVALGGTLIVDIPDYFKSAAGSRLPAFLPDRQAGSIRHQCPDYLKCYHSVTMLPNSLLRRITGCDTGFVTSNHHQAVEQLAPGLLINAVSGDGIIEGIEWLDPAGKSFLIGVQWHPERMDTSNSMSGKLLLHFYSESEDYFKKHQINDPL
jgi:putative glutamine amidotransferase